MTNLAVQRDDGADDDADETAGIEINARRRLQQRVQSSSGAD